MGDTDVTETSLTIDYDKQWLNCVSAIGPLCLDKSKNYIAFPCYTQQVPKSTITEQLSVCFPPEDPLPTSILLVNTSEWQGQVGCYFVWCIFVYVMYMHLLYIFQLSLLLLHLALSFEVKRKTVQNDLHKFGQ